jgi:hypothetical protein
MPQYLFLTDEWIAEARRIRDEYADRAPQPPLIRMNLVVTEVPFGGGTIEAHLDSSDGKLDLETGHLDNPEVSVSTDYATTKALFVDQNPSAAMQAFMTGKIRVQGDLTKLMALQPAGLSPEGAEVAQAIAQRIKAATAD